MATSKTILPLRSNYGSKRTMSGLYIVLHYTANDGDTASSNANYFATAYRGASAHFFVDDYFVVASVPVDYTAYSVGGSRYSNYKSTGGASLYGIAKNANTINIEMCDTQKNGTYDVSEKTLANTVELVKSLMKQYNIPVERVIRHFDVTGKSCPAYYVDSAKWEKFKSMLTTSSIGDYSLVFDATFYAQKYADLSGMTATQLYNHFIQYGMKEARQAISTFNPVVYRANNEDLQKAFGDEWESYYKHYITIGHTEARKVV